MSKTKTLFTVALLVLLGSLGAVQAQNSNSTKSIYTPHRPPAPGREAKMRCPAASGSAFPPRPQFITVTLDYSVPLAGDNSVGRGSCQCRCRRWPQNKRHYNGGRGGGERG